jgi:hypothetical protein
VDPGATGAVSGPSGPSVGRGTSPNNEKRRRPTEDVPAGRRRFRGWDQAAALVSQKILSIYEERSGGILETARPAGHERT